MHCCIADLRPKAAKAPRVKLDGNDSADLNEPIDILIPQDHLIELLHLHDESDPHAAIKKEALTNAKVKLSESNPNDNDESDADINK